MVIWGGRTLAWTNWRQTASYSLLTLRRLHSLTSRFNPFSINFELFLPTLSPGQTLWSEVRTYNELATAHVLEVCLLTFSRLNTIKYVSFVTTHFLHLIQFVSDVRSGESAIIDTASLADHPNVMIISGLVSKYFLCTWWSERSDDPRPESLHQSDLLIKYVTNYNILTGTYTLQTRFLLLLYFYINWAWLSLTNKTDN